MTQTDAATTLQSRFGADAVSVTEFRGETTVRVPKNALTDVLKATCDDLAFDMLIDVSTIDHLGQDPRFEVAYELYSTTYNVYLRVKSSTGEDEADFPSAAAIWPAANWHEREAYDMMGVRFTGHPDLRRILMWEGYPYFPLRKEFPLAGKDSDLPEVAFSKPAPLQGGPFVTAPGAGDTVEREPRARGVE